MIIRRLLFIAGMVLIVPVSLLTALAVFTPIMFSGALYLVGALLIAAGGQPHLAPQAFSWRYAGRDGADLRGRLHTSGRRHKRHNRHLDHAPRRTEHPLA